MQVSKRALLGTAASLAACTVAGVPLQAAAREQPAVTQKVYMDIARCQDSLNSKRTIGDKSALCADPEPLGRVVFGLYGDAAPDTVANFVRLVSTGAYTGTTFHKVFASKYAKAGQQGSRRMGQVDAGRVAAAELQPNRDTVSSRAFATPHDRLGTLSWALADNDDESFLQQREGYRSAEFLVTTGASPAFELDGENIAFGQVLEGWETLAEIAAVPVIQASETLQRYNAIASFIGDDRAATARRQWGRPLQALLIADAGVL